MSTPYVTVDLTPIIEAMLNGITQFLNVLFAWLPYIGSVYIFLYIVNKILSMFGTSLRGVFEALGRIVRE